MIFERLGVVEDNSGVRNRDDKIESRRDCFAGQIGHDTKPLEKGRLITPEAGPRQTVRKALALEVDRRKYEGFGYGKPGRLQLLSFPRLRRWKVDLEHTNM